MSYTNNIPPSAPLFLLILLLAASIPLPIHGQTTSIFIPGLPIIPITTSPPESGGNVPPPFDIIAIINQILGNRSPLILSVVGLLTCPGQGFGIGRVPVNLTCVTNGTRFFGGESLTNENGLFAVNATLSREDAMQILSTLLPNNTLTCLVFAPQQLVQSVVSCPTLTMATNFIVSLVQLIGTTVRPFYGRILNAVATGFVDV